MRLDQLIYIVEISRFGSISLAAEHLHVSQPTISIAIDALEKELGKKLFYRSRLGSQPTEDGKFLINKARQILNIVEEIQESTNPSSKKLKGTLAISAIPGLCISLLPKTFIHYKSKFPDVTLKLTEGGSFQIAERVKNEKVDLGFIATTNPNHFDNDESLIFKPLMYGQVMACVGHNSPLATEETLTLKEIINHPIITIPGYQMYKSVKNLLKKHGEPNIFFNSENRDIGRQILASGTGIGFYSSVIIKHDPYFTTGKLVAIPILDTEINLLYGYIRLKSKHLSTVAREFINTLEML